MKSKYKVLITTGVVIAAMAIFYFLSKGITTSTGFTISEGDAEKLAQCLTGKNITMYGSKYCPHCTEQKREFGDAFKFVNYIECVDNPEPCKGLRGVPAWRIGDKLEYGTKSLEELKKLSGC